MRPQVASLQEGTQLLLRTVAEVRDRIPEMFDGHRPTVPSTKVLFGEDSSYRIVEAPQLTFGRAWNRLQDLLGEHGAVALPALVECAKWHHEIGLYKAEQGANDAGEPQPLSDADIALYFGLFVLGSLLEDAFVRAEGRLLTDELLVASYASQFARWSGEAATGQIVIPVYRLALPPDRPVLQLTKTVHLGTLSATEKNRGWYGHVRDFASARVRDFANCDLAIDIQQFHGSVRVDDMKVATRFLTALRLIPVAEFVAPDAFHQRYAPSLMGNGLGPVLNFGPVGRWMPPEKRVLTHAEIDEALATFAQLSALPDDSRQRLDIALSRFLQSFVRERPEDALVDLVVALEALLLSENVQQELSFRFRIFAVLLLDDLNCEERNRASSLFELLYKARSVIVHSGSTIDSFYKKNQKKVQSIVAGNWTAFYEHAVGLSAKMFKTIVRHMLDGLTLENIRKNLERKAARLDAT